MDPRIWTAAGFALDADGDAVLPVATTLGRALAAADGDALDDVLDGYLTALTTTGTGDD
ncbi:hypothetical protein [Actinomadura sp. 6K520]|uniref:hypothetical protein n=1 Tax=Actinomadura sp. 6K520 TaxID=2530364 RepID=UPI0014045BB2|nr:hypothetical protein [Actinomadura sp. 6K520]